MKDAEIKNPRDYILRNRRLVCGNSRFEVFFDHVEGKDGFAVSDYLVVAPKRKMSNLVTGVAILPIVDGKYALLKVYRHAIADYSWEIPRGFVEVGEDSLESVMRDLEEETGLQCAKSNILSLGYVTPDAGTLAARIHLFVATQCQRLRPYVATEMGHCELKLFDFAEMEDMAEKSVIQDPSTLIAYYRGSLRCRTHVNNKFGGI